MTGVEQLVIAGWTGRDEAALPDYRENLQAALLRPSPEMLRLRQGLRHRPADIRHFALARYGRVPRESFFNPENLARIMGEADQAAAA